MSGPPEVGPAAPNRRTQLIVLGVLAVAILIIGIVVSQSGSDDSDSSGGDASSDTAQVEQTFEGIPQDGVFLGADAPETVIEFVDLQCPFCGEFARKAFPDVVSQHVRTGEIRYEMRVISFLGPDSKKAADVAAAATLQDRLYDFAETFYLNQGEENSGYVTEDFLQQIADATPGLDGGEAIDQSDSPDALAIVNENEKAASELGVNSTPTFYLVAGGKQTEMTLSALTADAFTSALQSARGG